MVACSLLFLLRGGVVGRRLAARFGAWMASLLAAGAFIVAIGIVMWLLPSLGQLSANSVEYGVAVTETPQRLSRSSWNLRWRSLI